MSKQEKRKALVREYVDRGYSANRIQRELRKQGLGMRRKTLLAQIRSVKGKPPPRHPERHIPHRAIAARKMRKKIRLRVRQLQAPKKVSLYQKVKGQGRRYHFKGTGKQLQKACMIGVRFPPRKDKPFLTVDAERFNADPSRYVSQEEKWDARPTIES